MWLFGPCGSRTQICGAPALRERPLAWRARPGSGRTRVRGATPARVAAAQALARPSQAQQTGRARARRAVTCGAPHKRSVRRTRPPSESSSRVVALLRGRTDQGPLPGHTDRIDRARPPPVSAPRTQRDSSSTCGAGPGSGGHTPASSASSSGWRALRSARRNCLRSRAARSSCPRVNAPPHA